MNVLVVSPHVDDETLGAGGTILKYKDAGHTVYWLNMTNMKPEYGYSEDESKKRQGQVERVAAEYNFEAVFDLELKPAALDTYRKSELIEKTSKVVMDVKPNVVILPYEGDIHTDHKVVFEVVFSSTKVFRYGFVSKILMMEILSETNFASAERVFSANYFVDVSDYFEKKIDIMQIYDNELGEHPFPRSVESVKALAILRGTQAGCKYAEAFRVLKIIE